MRKRTKNIAVICACLGVILVISAGVGVAKLKGFQLYTIDSTAMSPSLEPGDLAIAVKVPLIRLRPGDIITYKKTNQPQPDTKRVVSVNSNTGVVRVVSDNRAIRDDFVSSADILGKNSRSIPFAGYALNEIRRPEVLIGLIYIPAIWILVWEGRKLARAYWRKPYSI